MKLKFIPRSEMTKFEWDDVAQKWDRPPVDKAVLAELTKRRNAKSFGKLAFFLGLQAVAMFGFLYIQKQFGFWWSVPFLYCYWFVFGFWGALAHELQHKIVFTRNLDWFSEILFYIAQFLIWLSPTYSRSVHKIHHRYTMVKYRDFETKLHEHLTSGWLWWHFGLLIARILVVGAPVSIARDVKTLFVRAIGIQSEHMQHNFSEKERRMARWESAGILLFHSAVIIAAVWLQNWNLILLITLGWPVGGGFENLWHQTQHAGRSYDVNDQRVATRSVKVGPFIKMLYWGLDDHVEHHLFPAVPSCNLNGLKKAMGSYYIPPSRTMMDCWREMFAIARERDVRPDSEYLYLKESVKEAEEIEKTV